MEEVDLTPIIVAVISLSGMALTTVGTWALGRLAQWLNIRRNSAAIQAFDEAIAKAVHAGAGEFQNMILADGYGSIKVKSAILAAAAPYAIARFAPALKGIGLDPNDPAATSDYLTKELDRIFPTAMTEFARSPVTPPAPLPVFPAGSVTTAELNTASAAARG
jgi:hypothetical protein